MRAKPRREWTADEERRCFQLYNSGFSIVHIAEQLGRHKENVRFRLFRDADPVEEIPVSDATEGSEEGLRRDSIIMMDKAFQMAMRKAICRGQEHARIGVDCRPGTKRPVRVEPVSTPPTVHVLGDVVDA